MPTRGSVSLAAYPELVREWHPTKNGNLRPEDVPHRTGRKFWWRCSRGHEWSTSAGIRSRGHGCVRCANRGRQTLANRPDLVGELHPDKNAVIDPDEIALSSHKKLWWRCLEDGRHAWQAPPSRRSAGHGCPYCSGHRGIRLPLSHYRDLAREWHPDKNGSLRPSKISARSDKSVWWKCPKGEDHEWKTSVLNRVDGTPCPYCAGTRASLSNNLARSRPDLARQWHPTKNHPLTPEAVLPKSARSVWWRCSSDPHHEWQARVSARTSGSECPFCMNRRVTPRNSLARLYPVLARQWHSKKNGELTPQDVVPGSTRVVFWRCVNGKRHTFQAAVNARLDELRAHGGPVCSLCIRKARSLAGVAPKLARQLHPTKNGNLRAEEIPAASARRVFWQCPRDELHVWQAMVKVRVQAFSIGKAACPFCNNDRASPTNSLAARHPELAAQWHPTKNAIGPHEIVPGSARMCFWKCPHGPDHEWQARCYSRARDGKGCPFCAGKCVSVTNSLATRFPKLSRWWHPTKNGSLTPSDIVAGTRRKCWWLCPFGHEWQASAASVTASGTCRYCKPRKRRIATKRKPRRWVHLPSYDGARHS